MKSGLDSMPLFLLDDLLSNQKQSIRSCAKNKLIYIPPNYGVNKTKFISGTLTHF